MPTPSSRSKGRKQRPVETTGNEGPAQDILDAIDHWVRMDVAASAAQAAHQRLEQLDPAAQQAHFETLNAQALIEQRAAVRLVALATLRMEGRRAALRCVAQHLKRETAQADALASASVAAERADATAMASRQAWAADALARMTARLAQDGPGEAGDPDERAALAAIDRGIDATIFQQEEQRRARWATLGPAAVSARQALAIEQLAVGRALRATHRATMLSDLLAVADGLHAAARVMAQGSKDAEALRTQCERDAARELMALANRPRYRRQLIAWADQSCQDMEAPPAIELRSIAQGSKSRASKPSRGSE